MGQVVMNIELKEVFLGPPGSPVVHRYVALTKTDLTTGLKTTVREIQGLATKGSDPDSDPTSPSAGKQNYVVPFEAANDANLYLYKMSGEYFEGGGPWYNSLERTRTIYNVAHFDEMIDGGAQYDAVIAHFDSEAAILAGELNTPDMRYKGATQNSNSLARYVANHFREVFGLTPIDLPLIGAIAPGWGNDLSDPVTEAEVPRGLLHYFSSLRAHCFLAGVQVRTIEGSVPIESVAVGDQVLAFDEQIENGRGDLQAHRVVATFVNEATEMLNFHGVEVTPGHMFLTGEGTFRRLDEILAGDGTIVRDDGTVVRARTNLPVGAHEDQVIPVAWRDDSGTHQVTHMRAGAPFGRRVPDGPIYSLLGKMEHYGFRLRSDGLFESAAGEVRMAGWERGDPAQDDVARDNVRPSTDASRH